PWFGVGLEGGRRRFGPPPRLVPCGDVDAPPRRRLGQRSRDGRDGAGELVLAGALGAEDSRLRVVLAGGPRHRRHGTARPRLLRARAPARPSDGLGSAETENPALDPARVRRG